ncbi:hypothetical protein PIB30_022976 [Stylosanthes scabra]|uniref:Uncharacterized protein n=1 Tax=Stylosanthes scabra TaxID=79078 RepID=A0ABU6TBC0_9FABA|nr:hypothetical protein [Stylosanthes scabra]
MGVLLMVSVLSLMACLGERKRQQVKKRKPVIDATHAGKRGFDTPPSSRQDSGRDPRTTSVGRVQTQKLISSQVVSGMGWELKIPLGSSKIYDKTSAGTISNVTHSM